MSIFLYILLGAAAGLAISELFFDDDDDGGSAPTPPGDEGEIIRVDTAPGFTGTDGGDVFAYDAQASGSVTTSIDAGAGDDIIDLASLFGGQSLDGSVVQGGAGDDLISIQGDSSTISGGEGNDTIAADLASSAVTGGTGDDLIRVTNISADISSVDGGEGNDTIDVTDSDNIVATGGAGDDVLISDGRTTVGTGYTIAMDGGEGNDTLNHSVDVFPLPSQDPAESAAVLRGGAGADTFNLSLTTGDGSYSPSAGDPTTFLNEAARITDFEKGTDVLSLEIPTSLSGYAAATGVLTEDATAGTTTFSIGLTGGGLPEQTIEVVVNATGLAWSDVNFVGQTPATLSVA